MPNLPRRDIPLRPRWTRVATRNGRPGVTVTMVTPGLCTTSLGLNASAFTEAVHETYRAMTTQTAEVGSRTILHGLVVGSKGHWVPDWVSNAEGQQLQKDIWNELAAKLEEMQPGCILQLSQNYGPQ
ncbi:hypothetical protein F4818DRAFT_399220 [Hypoxylon cercidicola]|nr:hypothetical protein F4818DRAFT_399220 [Hypoxylon cercidicola]